MSGQVAYTTLWNDLTRRPIGGHRWLTDVEAQSAYGTHSSGLDVVDAVERDAQGVPRPRWVIGLTAQVNPRVRVRFFHPSGSLWRLIDYDNIGGRLFRWISVDYTYPDDARLYAEFECVMNVAATFRPDGTGIVTIDDKRQPNIQQATLDGAPVGGYWMNMPAFGHWGQLSDPEYGTPVP